MVRPPAARCPTRQPPLAPPLRPGHPAGRLRSPAARPQRRATHTHVSGCCPEVRALPPPPVISEKEKCSEPPFRQREVTSRRSAEAPHFLRAHSKCSSGPPTQLPGLITMSDRPSSPQRDTEMTGWGLRFPRSTAVTLPQPQPCRSCSDCAGTARQGSNATLDLGILQKPQLFPIRSEHKPDTLPNGVHETKQEAGASPVNLTNLRLQCKGDLLKGTPLTSLLFLLDGWHWWDILALCKAQQAPGTALRSRFSGAHYKTPLSRGLQPTEPYCLGGSLAESP